MYVKCCYGNLNKNKMIITFPNNLSSCFQYIIGIYYASACTHIACSALFGSSLPVSPPPADGQLSWERPMQVVEAGDPGPEGRALTLGLHQLPVRPVTQNGQHTSTVVATSLANAYGTVPRTH